MTDTVEPDDNDLVSDIAYCVSAVRLAYRSGLSVVMDRMGPERRPGIYFGRIYDVGPRNLYAVADGQERQSWTVLDRSDKQRRPPALGQVLPSDLADMLLKPHKKKLQPRGLAVSELEAADALADFVAKTWSASDASRVPGSPYTEPFSPSVMIEVTPLGALNIKGFRAQATYPNKDENREKKHAGSSEEQAAGAGGSRVVDARVAGEDRATDERGGRAGAGRPPGDRAPDQSRDAAAEQTAPPVRPKPRGEPPRALTPVADKSDNNPSVVSTGGTSIMGATPVYPISDPMADLANPGGYPSSSIRQEIGRRIQQRMLAKGWNQSELARRSEIGRDNISSYIRGNTLPGAVMVDKIAKALGCSPEDLAPGAGSASRMRGAGLEDPPLEIRQVPGQTDVWLRMVRRVSMDQAMRILNILQERPESAAAPAAPPPPTSAPPAIPAELTAATPAFAMNYKPKAAPAQAPAPAPAQAPAKPIPTKASQAAADAAALKRKRVEAAQKAAATRKANRGKATAKPKAKPKGRR